MKAQVRPEQQGRPPVTGEQTSPWPAQVGTGDGTGDGDGEGDGTGDGDGTGEGDGEGDGTGLVGIAASEGAEGTPAVPFAYTGVAVMVYCPPGTKPFTTPDVTDPRGEAAGRVTWTGAPPFLGISVTL